MRNTRKSTTTEGIIAWLLAIGICASTALYTFNGGRGWIFGAVIGIIFLIGIVAGIAER